MTKLKMVVEFEYDEDLMYSDTAGISWFYDNILRGDNLSLFEESDIGDFIGPVKVLEIRPHRSNRG